MKKKRKKHILKSVNLSHIEWFLCNGKEEKKKKTKTNNLMNWSKILSDKWKKKNESPTKLSHCWKLRISVFDFGKTEAKKKKLNIFQCKNKHDWFVPPPSEKKIKWKIIQIDALRELALWLPSKVIYSYWCILKVTLINFWIRTDWQCVTN